MAKEMSLEDIFDQNLKNIVSLEKLIYETYELYKQNPTPELQYFITNVSVNVRNQISLLLEFLPKVAKGVVLENIHDSLSFKYDDLFNLEKEISSSRQK